MTPTYGDWVRAVDGVGKRFSIALVFRGSMGLSKGVGNPGVRAGS